MATNAFGETLQFITGVKLKELERLSASFDGHFVQLLKERDAARDGREQLVSRLNALVNSMSRWPHVWSANFRLDDIKLFLKQAECDPFFSTASLAEWIHRAESEIDHQRTRFEFAKLFGSLLTEWITSKDNLESRSDSSSDNFEQINRKETIEQKAKLESIIFESKDVDTQALQTYLNGLFDSDQAKDVLRTQHERIKTFSEGLRKRTMSVDELKKVIQSVLHTDVFAEDKLSLLREFLRNAAVMEELASALNMQLSTLDIWTWPADGVLLEPRRHLNGKTRFHLDSEILTGLLLHYVGMLWAIEFRQCINVIRDSVIWKGAPSQMDRKEHQRRDVFVDARRGNTIAKFRREYQRQHLLTCQLPTQFEVTKDMYEEKGEDSDSKESHIALSDGGPRFDTPVDLKQSLLHILSADVVLDHALRGQATVLRTDLEWFGPSLPFLTIKIVFEFFGMPANDLAFFERFLACPIIFKDDPVPQIRVRKRGTPLGYMLSTLAGEVVMFVMDFAVNQRADGIFLHRIHDDFWLWNSDGARVEAAWLEMKRYASLAGLTFNEDKTGSITTGAAHRRGLPQGDVRWGFLRMNRLGAFEIDQEKIDQHIIELQRQLASTTSVFSWTQAYNKYMAFLVRNCGEPAFVYGIEHVDSIIFTLIRVQTAVFGSSGDARRLTGLVGHVSKMLEERFGISNEAVPYGWYIWPNAAGGLEIKDPLVDLFLLRESYKPESGFHIVNAILQRARLADEQRYAKAKQIWELGDSSLILARRNVSRDEPFFSFEEFVKGREERASWWHEAYMSLLRRPSPQNICATPQLVASLQLLDSGVRAFAGASDWSSLKPYWRWIIAVHHDEMLKRFGSLAIVESESVPVGMVQVFKNSRVKWEQ